MSDRPNVDAIRARAAAATKGPWRRPLNTRYRCHVEADLPEGEEPRIWIGGFHPDTGKREPVEIVRVPTWSNGKFVRARSGRDLEFIAHARQDVDDLIAEVDKLGARAEAAEKERDQLRARIDAVLAQAREEETRDQDGWPVVDTATLVTMLTTDHAET